MSLPSKDNKIRHTPVNTVPVMSCRVNLVGKGKCLGFTLPWG